LRVAVLARGGCCDSLESRNLKKRCLTAVPQHAAYQITIRYEILEQ